MRTIDEISSYGGPETKAISYRTQTATIAATSRIFLANRVEHIVFIETCSRTKDLHFPPSLTDCDRL